MKTEPREMIVDEMDVPNVGEEFRVHDEASANWVIRKITEARRYTDRVEEYADREIRRARREEEFFLRHYGPQLERWARQQLAKNGGRRKLIRLPAGAIGFRIAPAKLVVTDERKLLGWCRANLPGAVKTVERILKSLVRRHINATGELADGTDISGGGERFFVK